MIDCDLLNIDFFAEAYNALEFTSPGAIIINRYIDDNGHYKLTYRNAANNQMIDLTYQGGAKPYTLKLYEKLTNKVMIYQTLSESNALNIFNYAETNAVNTSNTSLSDSNSAFP